MKILYEENDMQATEKLLDKISTFLVGMAIMTLLVMVCSFELGFQLIATIALIVFCAAFVGGFWINDIIQAAVKERREEEGYHDLVRLNDSKPTKTDGWK